MRPLPKRSSFLAIAIGRGGPAAVAAGACLVLGALVAPRAVLAGTASGTLSVSTSVTAVCLISSGALDFGSYDPTAAGATAASTSLTLTCTPGTVYDIGLGAGAGTGATVLLRQLTSGSNSLGYKLFRDGANTQNWGTTIGTDTLHGTSSGTSLTNTITVYGQIPAQEVAPVGSYSDSVAITVTY